MSTRSVELRGDRIVATMRGGKRKRGARERLRDGGDSPGMMRRARNLLLALALLVTIPPVATAQLPGGVTLSVEAAPVVAIAAGAFAEAAPGLGAGTGVGAGAGAVVSGSLVGVYGSYSYLRFGCGSCAENGLDGLAAFGWEGGLQVTSPVRVARVRPWLRGGVLAHQLRVTGNGTGKTSPVAAGVAIGTGTDLPLGRLQLAPSVRFSTFPAEFEFSGLSGRATQVTYLSASVGLAYRF
jgi:hypothetical protein